DSEFIVRFAAAKSLVHVGTTGSDAWRAAVPVLVEGLTQDDEKARLEASEKLHVIGSDAKAAIPALKKLLTDKKRAGRVEGALALGAIAAKGAADSVPALIEGLNSSDLQAIRSAQALAELGPVAKDAVPELVVQFDAKNLQLRLHAAEAAARI